MRDDWRRRLAAGILACAPALGLAALPLPVAADPLAQFVANVQSASGTFVQLREQDGQPQAGSRQSGQFAFERPGKFRWAVEQPFAQLIVSDGARLIQYDPDLAQAIERDVDDSIGASPAAILFGSGQLGDAFAVDPRPAADGLAWLRITPRKADAGFVHADIGFKGDMPARLLLLDAFGQTSRIDLSDMRLNPSLPADLFRFQAPDGVDLVRLQHD